MGLAMETMHENMRLRKYDNKMDFPSYHRVAGRPEEEKKAMKKAYRDESERLESLFKSDLLEVYEVSGDKAEKAYNMAWSHGHSSGYAEVLNYFHELVELIK